MSDCTVKNCQEQRLLDDHLFCFYHRENWRYKVRNVTFVLKPGKNWHHYEEWEQKCLVGFQTRELEDIDDFINIGI